MYYAGGASSLITGVYFALSPHIEPLMPATLLNGYDVRQGSGRADDLNLYPFLDSIIRGLLEQKKQDETEAEMTLKDIVKGGDDNDYDMDTMLMSFEAELSVFRRNRILFPYNLFCEFEPDEATGYMAHSAGEAVARRMETMTSMLLEVQAWEERLKSDSMSGFSDNLRWVFLQMGGWTEHGTADSVVLVILELPHKNEKVADVDMTTAQFVKLIQLGPSGGEGDLFDDLASLRTLWESEAMIVVPRLSRLRLWQCSQKSELKGCVVALQAFYGEEFEIPMEVHGKKSIAQFFTDIVLEKQETIVSVDGYFVESHRGPQGSVFGALHFRTSAGATHVVGARESGAYFSIDLSGPTKDGFCAIALAGAVGPEGNINGLHILMAHEGLFAPTPPQAIANQVALGKARPASSISFDDDRSCSNKLPRPATVLGGERARSNVRPGGEDKLSLSVTVSTRRPHSAASARTSHSSMSEQLGESRRSVLSLRDSKDVIKQSGHTLKLDSTAQKKKTPVDWSRLSNTPDSRAKSPQVDEVAEVGAADGLLWKQEMLQLIREGKLTAQSRLVMQVEYCTAERPTPSLRGTTEQYVRVLEDAKERCRRDFWEYNIRVLGNCKFEGWYNTREVQTRAVKPRIGACDVILSWQHMSNIHHLPIHSKVQSRRWPNIEAICNEMLQAFPVQYHDIRFLLQNTSNGPIPHGARMELKVLQARDPLKILGSCVQTFSDIEGLVSVSIPAGSYVATFTHAVFDKEVVPYELGPPEQGLYEPFKRVLLSSKLSADKIKIVLYWDAAPADLDLVIVTPFTKVFHKRTMDPQSNCYLDGDVRSGFGPETVTVDKLTAEGAATLQEVGRSRQLQVFVHQNSNDGMITSSGAILQVIAEDGVIHKSNVPRKGIGHFWDAFSVDLKDLTISIRDRITPSEPSFPIMVEGANGSMTSVMSSSPSMGTLEKDPAMSAQEKSRSILRAHANYQSV